MIKLIDLLKEITEGKQVGLLYHFTYLDNIPNILKTGLKFQPNNTELSKYDDKFFISTTRDHTGIKFFKNSEYETRITLNGDQISERYSIEPINIENIWAKNDSGEYFNSSKNPYFEERIFSPNLGFLDPKYMIKIDTIVPEDKIRREIELSKTNDKIIKRFDDNIFKHVNFIKNFNIK
jgi:hypothetical protein